MGRQEEKKPKKKKKKTRSSFNKGKGILPGEKKGWRPVFERRAYRRIGGRSLTRTRSEKGPPLNKKKREERKK